jgi:hypothetical protein
MQKCALVDGHGGIVLDLETMGFFEEGRRNGCGGNDVVFISAAVRETTGEMCWIHLGIDKSGGRFSRLTCKHDKIDAERALFDRIQRRI